MVRPASKIQNRRCLFKYLFHPADLATFETDLDAVRMGGRVRKNFLNYTFGCLAATLVVLLHDQDPQPGSYRVSLLSSAHALPYHVCSCADSPE